MSGCFYGANVRRKTMRLGACEGPVRSVVRGFFEKDPTPVSTVDLRLCDLHAEWWNAKIAADGLGPRLKTPRAAAA